jgi:hypothetical protein
MSNIITSKIYSHITNDSIHKFKLGIQETLYFNPLEDKYDLRNVSKFSFFSPENMLASITKTNRLILFREIIAVFSVNLMKLVIK